MASARGVGSALKMHLRSRKRDFASSTTVSNTSNGSSPSSQKKRAVKAKSTSQGVKSLGQRVKIVAPTKSKFPILTGLKEREDHISNDSKTLLKYQNLVPARLIRRYKRFLADVVLLDGAFKNESVEGKVVTPNEDEEAQAEEVVTVYCPNTGPMVGLLDGLPNARVQLSKSDDPKRKYAYTLEMIQIHNGERDVWVGVHSTSANRMVEQALAMRWFTELGDYDSVRREVKFAKNSRVDFVLTKYAEDGSVAHEKYVEVKSVTLALKGPGDPRSRCAVFPDTVSIRAQKHVTELTDLLSTKSNAKKSESKEKETAQPKLSGAIIFLVQRDDCNEFAPSIQHDKKFSELCAVAAKSGIQLLGYTCTLEPDETNKSGAVRLLGPLLPARSWSLPDGP
ncbi:Sugar fermentation stimulation protein [Phytophthora palmivora]|uniref:Sugar fermentation stimulation protein n=1 Tax=Phytophthora palmivora TaxID=4796 RepID=A0A2P4YKC8_9STRA|nr:Sugar fermentation stimulation protein [Phytophthora palmivora]